MQQINHCLTKPDDHSRAKVNRHAIYRAIRKSPVDSCESKHRYDTGRETCQKQDQPFRQKSLKLSPRQKEKVLIAGTALYDAAGLLRFSAAESILSYCLHPLFLVPVP